jgi:hypothetical protein
MELERQENILIIGHQVAVQFMRFVPQLNFFRGDSTVFVSLNH